VNSLVHGWAWLSVSPGSLLTSMVEQRTVAVPDLGDEIVLVGDDLAQALVALVDEDLEPTDSDGDVALPSVLVDGFGVEALDRIWAVVRPTQELTSPRLLSPDRRTSHGRISFVTLDAEDLLALGDAVRALGAGYVRGEPRITELLTTFADTAPPQAAGGTTPADIIASFARWHGLLDLAWTPDAALLQQQIPAEGDVVEVVLDAAGEAAYLRLAARFASMWGSRQDLDVESFPWER
jgi:hypothetical protein